MTHTIQMLNNYLTNPLTDLTYAIVNFFQRWGVALIEARQAGLPVLASELDYVRDVLDPEQTFDPESAVSIARAVKRFLGLQEEPLPLQDAARFIEHLLKGEK